MSQKYISVQKRVYRCETNHLVAMLLQPTTWQLIRSSKCIIK